MTDRERAEPVLSFLPHRWYEGMAVLYVVMGENTDILVTKKQMAAWGKTERDLYCTAVRNIKWRDRPCMIPYAHLWKKYLKIVPGELNLPVAVLTTKKRRFGAGAILFRNLLEKYAGKMQADLYILPVSEHFLLVFAKKGADALERIRELQKRVFTEEELLTEQVIYYERKQKRVFSEDTR